MSAEKPLVSPGPNKLNFHPRESKLFAPWFPSANIVKFISDRYVNAWKAMDYISYQFS